MAHPPFASLRPCLLASICALLLLTGCGESDGESSQLRIDLLVSPMDGSLPAVGLTIWRDLEGGRETYPLTPVQGGTSEQYVARAPEGEYELGLPEGWARLQARDVLLPLSPGGLTAPVQLGRTYSIYLNSQVLHLKPAKDWVVRRVTHGEAMGSRVPATVDVETSDHGRLAAIRLPVEEWKGSVRLVGRLIDEHASADAAPAETGAMLAEPLLVTLPGDGGPAHARAQLTPRAPLFVVLVPASPDVGVDGVMVWASVVDLMIDESVDRVVRDGVARFDGVPSLGMPIAVRLGARDAIPLVLEPDAWQREAVLQALWALPSDLRTVRLTLSEGDAAMAAANPAAIQVQVRPRGVAAYGLVRSVLDGGDLVLSVPAGPLPALVRVGKRWARVTIDAEDGQAIACPPLAGGIDVGARVKGAGPGTAVRFQLEDLDGEWVDGHGFHLRVSPGGNCEGALPPGTYRVIVSKGGRTRARAAPLVITEPGTQVRLELQAPR